VTIVLRLVGEQPVPPPNLTLEIRDATGSLLSTNKRDLGELGWDGLPGQYEIRFALERLPLGEGEFQVSISLANAEGTRRYHRVDTAERFEVEPSDQARGTVRFEGEWSFADAERKVEAG
jgi:hypothetical protein